MEDELFQELLNSVQQAGEIARKRLEECAGNVSGSDLEAVVESEEK